MCIDWYTMDLVRWLMMGAACGWPVLVEGPLLVLNQSCEEGRMLQLGHNVPDRLSTDGAVVLDPLRLAELAAILGTGMQHRW